MRWRLRRTADRVAASLEPVEPDVHEEHVVPCGDLVEHDIEWTCPCGPRVEVVVVHHSLDGREVGG